MDYKKSYTLLNVIYITVNQIIVMHLSNLQISVEHFVKKRMRSRLTSGNKRRR